MHAGLKIRGRWMRQRLHGGSGKLSSRFSHRDSWSYYMAYRSHKHAYFKSLQSSSRVQSLGVLAGTGVGLPGPPKKLKPRP